MCHDALAHCRLAEHEAQRRERRVGGRGRERKIVGGAKRWRDTKTRIEREERWGIIAFTLAVVRNPRGMGSLQGGSSNMKT